MLKLRLGFDMAKRGSHPDQLEMSFFSAPETPHCDAGGLDTSLTLRDALTETLRPLAYLT
jgi:hypothetical protein